MHEAKTPTQALIHKAGGPRKVAATEGFGAKEATIYNWYHDGIPRKFWEVIAELAGVTVLDVFEADKAVRESEQA